MDPPTLDHALEGLMARIAADRGVEAGPLVGHGRLLL